MKKNLLIIFFFILFLIYPFSYIYCEFYPCGDSPDRRDNSMYSIMHDFIKVISYYEDYRHKYPENGKELLDFYYNNPKEKELLKDQVFDYQGFKNDMIKLQEYGRSSFGKPIRIIRLKEKPKSRLADINIELPFIAYYIDKKPKLSDYDLFTYGCWRRDEKSNKCILVTFPNTFKD